MSDYIDAGGVRTWYDDRGAGEPLVLLHGGMTDSRDFDGNLGMLADRFRLANRPGMNPADLAAVTCPALVVAGDDDMVTLDHTVELYRALPDAQLAILPSASHLLLHEKPEQVTALIADFLTSDPAPTMMPIRRAR